MFSTAAYKLCSAMEQFNGKRIDMTQADTCIYKVNYNFFYVTNRFFLKELQDHDKCLICF